MESAEAGSSSGSETGAALQGGPDSMAQIDPNSTAAIPGVSELMEQLDASASAGGSDYQLVQRIDSIWDEYLQDKQQDRHDRQQERQLKGKYADAFLEIAKWQLIGVFCAIACSGLKLMDFQPTELPIIIAGTLAEVFGIVYIIAKSLFDKNSKSPLESEPSKGIEKIKEMKRILESINALKPT
jgi:hypothetical protein